MTEADARAWIAAQHGSSATDRIERFLAMVADENARQNLIAPSTLATIWSRHALDSAQLLRFDRADEPWLDVGTGGGFPGVIVALLRDAPTILVEPRARRAAFLQHAVETLHLVGTQVVARKVEAVEMIGGIISARAVAPIDALLRATQHCAGPDTRWVLPRGQSGSDDLAVAQQAWKFMFHVEHSLTDPASIVAVLDRVRVR